MRLPKFDYVEPKNIKEAVSIMENDPAAKILAGGTDLLVNMKHKVERPAVIVNIKRIANLSFIRQDDDHLRIGALTTLKSIYTSPLIAEKLPALAQAAASVGSYHHQVMGTLAGNVCQQNRCKYFNQSRWWRSSRPICFKAGGDICHVVNQKETCFSSYCGDLAPALLVMDARAVFMGRGNAREIALENLFTGDGKVPLGHRQEEILTEIVIPKEAMNGYSSYIKFANRESIDFPIVGVAFWASEKTKEYRVAFTAVDRKPVRGKQVETFLSGKDLGDKTVEEAAVFAAKEATPAKTSLHSPVYKRKMMGLLFQSAVHRATGRLQV